MKIVKWDGDTYVLFPDSATTWREVFWHLDALGDVGDVLTASVTRARKPVPCFEVSTYLIDDEDDEGEKVKVTRPVSDMHPELFWDVEDLVQEAEERGKWKPLIERVGGLQELYKKTYEGVQGIG